MPDPIFKRAVQATWSALMTPLRAGEPSWNRTTGEVKVGDGTTLYDELPFLARCVEVVTGNEPRPAGSAPVFWLVSSDGPDPANIGTGDFVLG